VSWTEVVPDAPAGDTRWAGCGVLDGLVEFQGEMWLVGCARYNETTGTTMSNEVWSTTDGAAWTGHEEPPWARKIWHAPVATVVGGPVATGLPVASVGYTEGELVLPILVR